MYRQHRSHLLVQFGWGASQRLGELAKLRMKMVPESPLPSAKEWMPRGHLLDAAQLKNRQRGRQPGEQPDTLAHTGCGLFCHCEQAAAILRCGFSNVEGLKVAAASWMSLPPCDRGLCASCSFTCYLLFMYRALPLAGHDPCILLNKETLLFPGIITTRSILSTKGVLDFDKPITAALARAAAQIFDDVVKVMSSSTTSNNRDKEHKFKRGSLVYSSTSCGHNMNQNRRLGHHDTKVNPNPNP